MTVVVITNKIDPPADKVISYLKEMDVNVFRFNTEDFCCNFDTEIRINNFISSSKIYSGTDSIDFNEVRSVFYRRPKKVISGVDDVLYREFIESESSTFLNWLWKSLDVFWVSKPINIRIAESKIDQLKVATKLGFKIPKTLITNKPESVINFYEECKGDIISKVLSKGVIEKNGKMFGIYTNRVEKHHLCMIDSVKNVPCIFQELVKKKFELRITVVGNEVFATEIHSQNSEKTKHDWRRYDFDNTPHKQHTLPEDIKRKCINLVRYYNLAFSAIDMIVTPDDDYIFLEINPNGQWLWIEQLTGQQISKSIAEMLFRGSF